MDREDVGYIHNGILLSIKYNEILPLLLHGWNYRVLYKWNVRQRKTNTTWFHLYVESKKQNKCTDITKQKQRYREQTGGHQRGGWEK